MKKIITGIVIIGIILGLGFGGYWLYKKFTGADIASELEKIEINPDERKELVENLSTKDEKIDMIINLIEDINYERIFYNDNFFGTFHVKDKYQIDYIVDGVAIDGYDYMNNHYVSGTRNAGTLWVTGSNMVYVWLDYKKESTYQGNESTIVNLQFEDELLYGKYDMGFKNTAGDGTFYLEFSKKIKDNRDKIEFSEEKGKFFIKRYANQYINGILQKCLNFFVETDGVSYIHIQNEYEGKSISGKDIYRYDHYIEINNVELFEKIIFPLKKIKEFPEMDITENDATAYEILLETQSKYDHKKLMADYIASIEPKNQTWNVEKVEDVDASVGVNTSYLDKTGENDLMFLLSIDFTGKLELSNSMSSSRCKYFGIKQGFEIKSTETSKTYQLDIDSINSILIFNSISNPPYIESGTGELNDFTLHILFVVNDDKSCSLKLSGNFSIKDVNGLMDLSFEYNETIDSYKRWGNYIEGINAKWESKILLNSYSDTDKNGNKYILNKQQIIDDKSEDNLLDDGTTYSRIIGDLLRVVLN